MLLLLIPGVREPAGSEGLPRMMKKKILLFCLKRSVQDVSACQVISDTKSVQTRQLVPCPRVARGTAPALVLGRPCRSSTAAAGAGGDGPLTGARRLLHSSPLFSVDFHS